MEDEFITIRLSRAAVDEGVALFTSTLDALINLLKEMMWSNPMTEEDRCELEGILEAVDHTYALVRKFQ